MPSSSTKQRRGFAILKETNPAALSAISKAGGEAAHAQGTAHEFTSEEARIAGQKGGRAVHKNRRVHIQGGAALFNSPPMTPPDGVLTLSDEERNEGSNS